MIDVTSVIEGQRLSGFLVRLMFSTDYSHRDFDDPCYTFKVEWPNEDQVAIFGGNAKKRYGLA